MIATADSVMSSGVPTVPGMACRPVDPSWPVVRPDCSPILFRHIWLDPETVCYLDYNSDRACSAGPDPRAL